MAISEATVGSIDAPRRRGKRGPEPGSQSGMLAPDPGLVSVAVKAIIPREGKILLLRRRGDDDTDGGLWEIPGGRMLFGEEPHRALAREVAEETGLKLAKMGAPAAVWTFMAGKRRQVVGITFFCTCRRGKVRLSVEHTGFRWAGAADMRILAMHPALRAELQGFFDADRRGAARSPRLANKLLA
jgi:8-oxo-dGTP diphosphatase